MSIQFEKKENSNGLAIVSNYSQYQLSHIDFCIDHLCIRFSLLHFRIRYHFEYVIWMPQYHRTIKAVKISMVKGSRNKYKDLFVWLYILEFDIATAADGVVGVVFVIIVDQSSLTVIWSMDRYNEHWYAWPMQYRTLYRVQYTYKRNWCNVHMCYLFWAVFATKRC